MALKDPAAVHDTTETAGIGSYTLLGGDPTGRRSLADAVNNGDAANGDTVWYYCSDSTTGGATALDFEWGVGTISSSGGVLSRDTIYQSSNGGSKVAWGSGGTRDLLISSSLDGLPKLADPNTWTAAQAVTQSTDGTLLGLTVTNANAGTAANGTVRSSADAVSVNLTAHGSGRTGTSRFGSTLASYAELLSFGGNGLMIGTSGANPVRLGTAGNLVAQITGAGVFQNAAGNTYDAFPSGTRLLLGNNTVPTGWAIVSGLADKTILTTSTASEIDDVGGSWTISGLSTSIGATTLTEAQIPSHTHGMASPGTDYNTSGIGSPGSANRFLAGEYATNGAVTSAATGGGGSHTHTATTTAGSSWRPAYYKAGWIEKS